MKKEYYQYTIFDAVKDETTTDPEVKTIDDITKRIDELQNEKTQIETELQNLKIRKYEEFLKKDCHIQYEIVLEDGSFGCGKGKMFLVRDGRKCFVFDFLPFADELSVNKLDKLPKEYRQDAECVFVHAKEEYNRLKAEQEKKRNERFDNINKAFQDTFTQLQKQIGLLNIPEDHAKKIIKVLVKEFHPDNGNTDPEIIKTVLQLKSYFENEGR